MMRRARCSMAWTLCHPSSGAMSTKITTGSSRSSANGRSSSARQQPRRKSPPPLQSPQVPVWITYSSHLLSQHPSQDPLLKRWMKELLQSHSQTKKQRKSQNLISEKSQKVCSDAWKSENDIKYFITTLDNVEMYMKHVVIVIMFTPGQLSQFNQILNLFQEHNIYRMRLKKQIKTQSIIYLFKL